MKKSFVLIFLMTCAFALTAAAQKQQLTGFVSNGTTHKASAGDEVILLDLSQGMQEETRTKTDAQGKFKLTMADAGVMHLIRVRHQNVNYHEPVRPGSNEVMVTVYDSMTKVPSVQVINQSEVLQAGGNTLQAIELFRVRNPSSPPVTQPEFEFYLPDGAQIRLAQAAFGNGGMPTKTPPVPTKEKNRYSLIFPIRPGVTQIEVVYTLPYTGSLSIQPKFVLKPLEFYVVTAKGIDFSASGNAFKSVPQWPIDTTVQGVDTHLAQATAAEKQMAFKIGGAGLLPEEQQNAQGQSQPAPQPAADNRPGGGLGEPNERPDPLQSSKWMFLAVLTLFLAAGGVYVYTSKGQPAMATGKAQDRSQMLLEAMKEEIFQLESDRLQGKISGKEYESAKAALDKTLQRAVQRQSKK